MVDRKRQDTAQVNFLWLGETLLFPHIWPIVDRLARCRKDIIIDLWVSTDAHEALIESRRGPAHDNIRIRRSGFFRHIPVDMHGSNIALPPKLLVLMSLLPHLFRAGPVIVAEQTSLWIPKILPGFPPFIFTVHGAGPISHGKWKRLRAADKVMVPSALMATEMQRNGIKEAKVAITGYAKSAFSPSAFSAELFEDKRPVILYNPHWQAHRSSWPVWGRRLIDALVQQNRWNVIFAPHQRIVDTDPSVRVLVDSLKMLPHVHADLDGFSMVDGSYTGMADIYLGDTSSQILEFVAKPRPVVLLRPQELSWAEQDSGQYALLGECVTSFEDIIPAIDRAAGQLEKYREMQISYAGRTLGLTGQAATQSAVDVINTYLPTNPATKR